MRVDLRGQLWVDTSKCLKSQVYNVRHSTGLEREKLIWSLSSSLLESVRREFLAQYWLASRVFQILTEGDLPYDLQDRHILKWFVDFRSYPRYRDSDHLSKPVGGVLKSMLAFTTNRRYRTLGHAVQALKTSLLQQQFKSEAL